MLQRYGWHDTYSQTYSLGFVAPAYGASVWVPQRGVVGCGHQCHTDWHCPYRRPPIQPVYPFLCVAHALHVYPSAAAFRLFRRLTRDGEANATARTTVWAIVGTLVIAFVFSIASMWVGRHVFPSLGIDARIDISLIKDGFVALNVILVTILLSNLTRHQQQVLEEERTHTESIQTRYDALEKQIDPHFLFNSLNTLDGLIGYDDSRAHDYLHQLAQSYRYIMQQQRLVTLADEMRFTDNFIAMMQIRYGNNLRVDKHIEEKYLSAMVVPISVQLLVENALQHNVVSDRHPLTVTIKTVSGSGEDGSGRLGIMVSNPLQPRSDADDSAHGSIGLSNLSQRCQLVLHRDIDIRQTGTAFEVEIPLE